MIRMTPERVLQAIWLGWWISWIAAAFWSDRAAKRPAAQQQIVYRLFAATGAVLLFGMYHHDPVVERILWRTPEAIAWGLVVLSVTGLLFTWWARIHLGRLWSSAVGRKADHRIVDTGPYGLVRHPIYTGITLAAFATAALRGTAAAWAGAVVMTWGWYIKARLEETFLRTELGRAAYDDYCRRTPMLVPRPWRSGVKI